MTADEMFDELGYKKVNLYQKKCKIRVCKGDG